MDQAVRELRIRTYNQQLTACDEICATLSKELENPNLPEDRMVTLGHRLDQATRESNGLRFILGQLEHEQTGH